MLTLSLILSVVALAYANGANDNFKGVATLYGSGTLTFRRAIVLATAATALGSIVSIVLAGELAKSFSGRGLVPEDLTQDPTFLVSVAGAAAITILLATRLGLPTSTTHALTGALIGIGVLHTGSLATGNALWHSFLQPLLVSPFLAVILAGVSYRLLARGRQQVNAGAESCVCLDVATPVACGAMVAGGSTLLRMAPVLTMTMGTTRDCAASPTTRARIGLRAALGYLHGLSGAAVCFGRAVNDTPKIAALWIAAGTASQWPLMGTTVAISMGGLLGARRIAETMGRRITTMNAGQGATSNLVTAAVVLGASGLGLPVSTTHVSCGAIMGIGAVTGQANGRVVWVILLAWLTTLPLGAAMGCLLFTLLH